MTRPFVFSALSNPGARSGERIGGSLQNLARRAAKRRVRVMAVEKPGVAFLDAPAFLGSAVGSSEQFRREHTFERVLDWMLADLSAD